MSGVPASVAAALVARHDVLRSVHVTERNVQKERRRVGGGIGDELHCEIAVLVTDECEVIVKLVLVVMKAAIITIAENIIVRGSYGNVISIL